MAELLDKPVQDLLVEVVAPQVGVAVGGLYLEDTVAQLEDGDVEGPSAQVEHGDGGVRLALVHAVGQGRGGGLVDYSQHLQAGDGAGVLGGLALGVVEVGGHRDNRLGYGFTQLGFGVLLDFLEDKGRDLGRRVTLAGHFDFGVAVGALDDLVGQLLHRRLDLRVVELAAHQPFHGEQGVLRVGHGLSFGNLAHVAFAGFGVNGHNRRRYPGSLGVFDNLGFAGFDHRRHRVGGSQINAQDFTHLWSPLIRGKKLIGLRLVARGPLLPEPVGSRGRGAGIRPVQSV